MGVVIDYFKHFIDCDSQVEMGNEAPVPSKYQDQNKWMPLAQTSRKELVQHKITKEIVQKHFLKNIQWESVQQDSIIFEWRKDPRTALYCVQLLEIRKIQQEEEQNCLSTCQNTQKQTDLLVYTEHIYKLYEQNPKCQLTQVDQLTIFKGIIEGIDMLAKKFGQFSVTKDMVGYNPTKRGKAWINENFCVNRVQVKRNARKPEERLKWEKQVIEALLNLCKLCSIDKNIKNCKFYNVIEIIMRNRLFKFSSFRDFGPFKEIDLSQGPYGRATRECRKSGEHSSGHDSSELDDKKRVKIFSKTFEFPLVKMHEPERNMTTLEGLNNQTMPNIAPKITLGGKKKESVSPGQKNQVQVRNNNRISVNSNQSFLLDANHFNKKHKQPIQPQRQSYERRQQPEHYAILNEMQESRSSRASSKMIPKDQIKMVDSWMMVENRQQSENSKNPRHKIVLEQSVILRVPNK